MSNKVYTDRTRTIAYQRCHRLGWLSTYEGGKGIQKKSLNAHLLIGTYVHQGINQLFDGKLDIDEVVGILRINWDEAVANKQVDECLSEYQQQLLNDCWNLVEGQVRAFELVMLPQVLSEYDVLDTEKEESYLLDGDGGTGPIYRPDLWWMARLDATLKHKQTGDVGPLSIKTASRYDKRAEERAKCDMQGCSEMWTLQQRGLEEQVMFVQMLYLLKGQKKVNEQTGQWEFQSPLTKGYRRPAVGVPTVDGYEYAHSYWWTCKELHIKGVTKKGEPTYCEGQKKHSCQGWEAIDVGRDYPGSIQAWIQALNEGTIQPLAEESGTILSQQFILPAPIYRSPQEIKRWKRSTIYEKRQIIENAEKVLAAQTQEDREERLDKYFPMYTHSCVDPGPCTMREICHGGLTDYVGSGFYEERKANHPIEETENG